MASHSSQTSKQGGLWRQAHTWMGQSCTPVSGCVTVLGPVNPVLKDWVLASHKCESVDRCSPHSGLFCFTAGKRTGLMTNVNA